MRKFWQDNTTIQEEDGELEIISTNWLRQTLFVHNLIVTK